MPLFGLILCCGGSFNPSFIFKSIIIMINKLLSICCRKSKMAENGAT